METSVNDIIRQAILALECALARLDGLAHCDCGRWQWTGDRWLMVAPVGGSIIDGDAEGPFTEAECGGCGCWCSWSGDVHRDRVAGDETQPHEDTSIAGDGDRELQEAGVG